MSLLFYQVHWLQFQVTCQLRYDMRTIIRDRLHTIECQLKQYRHSTDRQHYHENKYQLKILANKLDQIEHYVQKQIVSNATYK
jgi:hypothetical protein